MSREPVTDEGGCRCTDDIEQSVRAMDGTYIMTAWTPQELSPVELQTYTQ